MVVERNASVVSWSVQAIPEPGYGISFATAFAIEATCVVAPAVQTSIAPDTE